MCAGTLRMSDGFGNPIYVYNPFTYEQLHTMAGRGTIDAYLQCISQMQVGTAAAAESGPPAACRKPTVPSIDEQGVSVISVIERCKSNYQQMQWDAGAFMLYDGAALSASIRGSMQPPPPSSNNNAQQDETAACLLEANKNKESNNECMQVVCACFSLPYA